LVGTLYGKTIDTDHDDQCIHNTISPFALYTCHTIHNFTEVARLSDCNHDRNTTSLPGSRTSSGRTMNQLLTETIASRDYSRLSSRTGAWYCSSLDEHNYMITVGSRWNFHRPRLPVKFHSYMQNYSAGQNGTNGSLEP
jgi:hypothetical protein